MKFEKHDDLQLWEPPCLPPPLAGLCWSFRLSLENMIYENFEKHHASTLEGSSRVKVTKWSLLIASECDQVKEYLYNIRYVHHNLQSLKGTGKLKFTDVQTNRRM